MPKFRFRHPFIALLLLVAMLCQGTWALAGTTGTLSGLVVLADNHTPITGAKVSVSSPSQTASATTDAQGHFAFVSLAPDSYTVSVEKEGYQSVSQTGIAVFADNTQTVSISLLKVIGKVTTRSVSALVKPGTTADVYSVDASTADRISALGGGGGLNNAYSAIASVPGAYVPSNQQGWFQSVSIRGGDYDQVGYEFDGIPVNRSFDNYPSTNASALGQQELQVYTGASPANAEAQGLSGFINQVIKSGTYPGFASLDLGIGGPTYYHKANFEIGGANQSRLFSYYIGIGGYDQDYRYYDQNNGASLSNAWGTPFDALPCPGGAAAINYSACYALGSSGFGPGPGGYVLGPFQMFGAAHIMDRENVVNLHFGIPHRKDAGRDDVQLLFDTSNLNTYFYSSPSDWTTALFDGDQNGMLSGNGGTIGANYPFFFGGYQYNGPLGAPLAANYQGLTTKYDYPSTPGAWLGTSVPAGLRDADNNAASIVKLQYQHNIGSSAYFRVYGYLFYSDWFLFGPNTTFSNYVGINPPDYELSTHTRGLSASYADQINAKNLINAEASIVGATSVRDNNTQMLNAITSSRKKFAYLVDSKNPTSGICYNSAGAAQSCYGGNEAFATFGQAYSGSIPAASGTCGTGPCEWYVAESGPVATYNNVKPTFTSFSLSDQWKPTDRLLVNLGLRYDNFKFQGGNTTGPARDFWFNAWNSSQCVSTVPGSNPVDKTNLGLLVTQPCSAANTSTVSYAPATLTNASAQVENFDVWQPRIGVTYTVNPLNVLRVSYGKYTQAPNSAFEQYNTLQQNLPGLLGPTFYAYGRTTPAYPIQPEISYNTDFSWEHQVKGSDLSWKVTPFYRKTQNQIQQFFLNQKTAFVSGLNVGAQTNEGVEFQLNKGDFNREGWAWQLSYTYTHSTIKFSPLSNGSTIVTPINQTIQQYNAFTSYCASHTSDARCGGGAAIDPNTGTPIVAAACYTQAGAPDTGCAAGDIANPYWNAPVQSLLDPNGTYAPFDIFPLGIGTSDNSYIVPHVATLIVNYKHRKWSFTPSLQFQAGQKYGAPLTWPGIDPLAGCGSLAGSASRDPRYPYGATVGAPFDATTCAGSLQAIPDPFTGAFDSLGAFTAPSQLLGNMQISYEASPRVTLQLTLANVLQTCWGGTQEPWTQGAGNRVCGYGIVGGGAIQPVGNVYNPGAVIQPYVQYPYLRGYGPFNVDGNSTSQPFNAYLDVKVKL